MKRAPLFFLALSSVLAACSSNDDASTGKPPDTPNDPTGGPCDLDSGFPGDDMCIPPPRAGEGIQLHVGPASYTDRAVLEPWLLEGGQENVKCFVARVKEGGFYYLRQENRMRPGSHHMLINRGGRRGPLVVSAWTRSAARLEPRLAGPGRNFPEPGTMARRSRLARYCPPD